MRKLYVCMLAAGITLLVGPASDALIIRHDVPDSDYVVADAEYPALVDLISPGDCIGTLVHESYLLTVAHCAVDLNVGQSLEVNGASYVVAEVILHPNWQDLDEYDIALVRFEDPVVGVTPYPIYRGSSEVESVVTLVGRGVTATGLVGEDGASSDGKLRRATNVVSAANDHFLEVIFESVGQGGVTDLEGVGAAGDSGCPSFLEVDGVIYVAGLNSYGDGDDDIGIGQYGSRDYQTRISRYLEWLDSLVDFPPIQPDDPDDPTDDPDDPTDDSGDPPNDPDDPPDDPATDNGPIIGIGCSASRAQGGPGWALCILVAVVATRRRRAAQ